MCSPEVHACKHEAGDEAGGSVANAVAHVGTTAKDSPVSEDDGVDSDDYDGGGGGDEAGAAAASTTASISELSIPWPVMTRKPCSRLA